MQKREKILAAIVGMLMLMMLGYFGFTKMYGSIRERRGRIQALQVEIQKKTGIKNAGLAAEEQIEEWEARSLPSNLQSARTEYQNWLTSIAAKERLSAIHVDAGIGQNYRNIYHKLPFTVRARGSLEQATQFMYAFYGANHLHQLREIVFKPLENSKDLDLSFTIDALVLPNTARKHGLAEGTIERLALKEVKEYRTPIVARNLFAAYVPPPLERPSRPVEPPRIPDPPRPPAFDFSKLAVLTAVVSIDETPQAWVNLKTTCEMVKLHEGDEIKIGQFAGKITRIGERGIEVTLDGKRRLLRVGKSLAESVEVAIQLPPEAPTEPADTNAPASQPTATEASPDDSPSSKPVQPELPPAPAANSGNGTILPPLP